MLRHASNAHHISVLSVRILRGEMKLEKDRTTSNRARSGKENRT